MVNIRHGADVKAGVAPGRTSMVNSKDLPNGFKLNVKLSEDDMSLFSVFHNINDPVNLFNSDLSKINKWVAQYKISFNPDPTKQAQEIIFS